MGRKFRTSKEMKKGVLLQHCLEVDIHWRWGGKNPQKTAKIARKRQVYLI